MLVTLQWVLNSMGTKLRTTQIGPLPLSTGPSKISASGLKNGAFLLVDLVGLPVIDVDTGRRYGEISAVDEVVTGLLITVRTEDGDVLMPYVDAFFKKVDIEEAVYISPIPGFFKEEA